MPSVIIKKLNNVRKQSMQSLSALTSTAEFHPFSLPPLAIQNSRPCLIDLKDVQLLSDMVILVMGATGGGKSTIINIIAGDGEEIIPINDTMDPSTEYAVVRTSIPQGNVCFIEIPETKESQFPELYQRYDVIGIIVVHKVTDTRIAGELARDLEEIKAVCKQDPTLASRIVCVTSHWTTENCDNRDDLWVEDALQTTEAGWGREVKAEELEFRRFLMEDGTSELEMKGILDHLLQRAHRPSSILSTVCEDVTEARDWKIVVVMGVTGAGKSNFINKARNFSHNINDDSLESSTKEIQAYKLHINRHKLILVDTPGFDDSHRSDLDILKLIAAWLESTFRKSVLLDGVLYFHRISDNRMSGSALSNLKVFQSLMGKGLVSNNVKFVTTMWDQGLKGVKGELERREYELKTNYWASMVNDGASVVRFGNSHVSAREVLKSFRTDWHKQQALQLQVELVKQHQRLKETKAGQIMYAKLGQLLEEHTATLQKKKTDPLYQPSKDPEYKKLIDALKGVERDMKEMHLGIGGRLHSLLARLY